MLADAPGKGGRSAGGGAALTPAQLRARRIAAAPLVAGAGTFAMSAGAAPQGLVVGLLGKVPILGPALIGASLAYQGYNVVEGAKDGNIATAILGAVLLADGVYTLDEDNTGLVDRMTGAASKTQISSTDSADDGTIDLWDSCDAGSADACSALDKRNSENLEKIEAYLRGRRPDLLDEDGNLTNYKWGDREFALDSGDAGRTHPIWKTITLNPRYASATDLADTVTHELLHRSSGFWGMLRTHHEDIRYGKNEWGPIHLRYHVMQQESLRISRHG